MTPIQRGALLLLALFLLFVRPVLGQTPSLEPGTRLRVHADGLQLSGEFIRWDGDTLVVRGENEVPGVRSDHVTAISEIQRLDRGVPRSRGGGAARGAKWGGAIGFIAGAVLGAVDQHNCAEEGKYLCFTGNPEIKGALAIGALYGGLGAGIGALVGVIHPGTAWEPVPLQEGAGR